MAQVRGACPGYRADNEGEDHLPVPGPHHEPHVVAHDPAHPAPRDHQRGEAHHWGEVRCFVAREKQNKVKRISCDAKQNFWIFCVIIRMKSDFH